MFSIVFENYCDGLSSILISFMGYFALCVRGCPIFPFSCCYTCLHSISSHLDHILTGDVSMQLYSPLLVIFDMFVDLCNVH